MFKFTLPRYAAVDVNLPSGGSTVLVHVGDGVFVSRVPPLVLGAALPAGAALTPSPVLISWDSSVLAGDVTGAAIGFDLQSAGAAVEAAAAAGDAEAVACLDKMLAAEKALEARLAIEAAGQTPALPQ